MIMIESVKKYMRVPVEVYTFITQNSAGEKVVSGVPLNYKCLPNYEEKRVINTKGVEVVSSIQLFLPRTALITPHDQIKFAGLVYDIKSLNGFYGGKTVGLWMVML
jgi:hypothetical protein